MYHNVSVFVVACVYTHDFRNFRSHDCFCITTYGMKWLAADTPVLE
jgi:hypothetical protein